MEYHGLSTVVSMHTQQTKDVLLCSNNVVDTNSVFKPHVGNKYVKYSVFSVDTPRGRHHIVMAATLHELETLLETRILSCLIKTYSNERHFFEPSKDKRIKHNIECLDFSMIMKSLLGRCFKIRKIQPWKFLQVMNICAACDMRLLGNNYPT